MNKREWLMLARNYREYGKKLGIGGWFLSEKLDGVRALWDGGLSLGKEMREVPWANTAKVIPEKQERKCTGLWSRYGKVIFCPEWYSRYLLETFENLIIDGELWTGRGKFQRTISIVGSESGKEEQWKEVMYCPFDIVPVERLFQPGYIRNMHDNRIIEGYGKNVLEFRGGFQNNYEKLLNLTINSETITVIPQHALNYKLSVAIEQMEEYTERFIDEGAEGVMLRHPGSVWEPTRSRLLLKYKPYLDETGVVLGYKEGKGKYEGMIGSLEIQCPALGNKIFQLSGLKDSERELDGDGMVHFKRGDIIRFKYRELTDDGLPKEARYWR